MDRAQLDQVLSNYAANNPNTAEFDGNTFAITPPKSGGKVWLTLIFLLLGGLLTIAAGVGLIGVAVAKGGGNGRAGGALLGVGLIVGVIFVGGLVYISKKTRTAVDLSTGEVTVTNPLRSRPLVNFNDVHAYNRFDQRVNGVRVNSTCHLNTTVQGKRKPKVKKVPFGQFKKLNDFEEFGPVVNALITYYKPQPTPSMLSQQQAQRS